MSYQKFDDSYFDLNAAMDLYKKAFYSDPPTAADRIEVLKQENNKLNQVYKKEDQILNNKIKEVQRNYQDQLNHINENKQSDQQELQQKLVEKSQFLSNVKNQQADLQRKYLDLSQANTRKESQVKYLQEKWNQLDNDCTQDKERLNQKVEQIKQLNKQIVVLKKERTPVEKFQDFCALLQSKPDNVLPSEETLRQNLAYAFKLFAKKFELQNPQVYVMELNKRIKQNLFSEQQLKQFIVNEYGEPAQKQIDAIKVKTRQQYICNYCQSKWDEGFEMKIKQMFSDQQFAELRQQFKIEMGTRPEQLRKSHYKTDTDNKDECIIEMMLLMLIVQGKEFAVHGKSFDVVDLVVELE